MRQPSHTINIAPKHDTPATTSNKISYCIVIYFSSLAPILYKGPTPSAQNRRVACLTFSRHIEGIAKRPLQKHDQKTRHVGLTHVAQPSYRAFACSTLAKFSMWHTIRSCVRTRILLGFPGSSSRRLSLFLRTGKLPILPIAVVIEVLAYWSLKLKVKIECSLHFTLCTFHFTLSALHSLGSVAGN